MLIIYCKNYFNHVINTRIETLEIVYAKDQQELYFGISKASSCQEISAHGFTRIRSEGFNTYGYVRYIGSYNMCLEK